MAWKFYHIYFSNFSNQRILLILNNVYNPKNSVEFFSVYRCFKKKKVIVFFYTKTEKEEHII